MAKIVDYRDVFMDDLDIGKSQVRSRDVGEEIDELAESIETVGLLHPIVVCPGAEKGRYEILLGQRRFLAHRMLQRKTITAAVFDVPVDPTTAKIISLTENMVRRSLSRTDLIDACTALYKKYGSVRSVVEVSGLPDAEVRDYVKYDRLMPELKTLVDSGSVDVKVALRAQDAASVSGAPDPKEALKYAKEMAGMSGVNQQRIVKERRANPSKSPDEIIEMSKTGAKLVQVLVTLSLDVQGSLKDYSQAEGTTQDDAAATLISEGLVSKGFLRE